MNENLSPVEIARLLLQMRSVRWDYFRGDLFDEYAWNILLILFIAQDAGRQTTEGQAVREASVPPAVGVRWIAHLEQSDLIRRGTDPDIVGLTDRSHAQMTEYLDEIVRMIRR